MSATRLAEGWTTGPRRSVERDGIQYAEFSDGIYQRRLDPLDFWEPVASSRVHEVKDWLGISETP